MKPFIRHLLSICSVCCLVACDSPAPPPAKGTEPATSVPFDSLPGSSTDVHELVKTDDVPGIETQIIGAAQDSLLILAIDPTVMEPILLGQPNRGISARNAMIDNGFSAVIGSGFVSSLHTLEPVGLLQIDGQTLNPVQGHGYTRILGINDTGIGVVHREAYQRELFHSALQAGPGIVEQGQLDISKRDLQRPVYFRSFVAVCKSRWLVGVSLAPTHLRTLGQTLLQHIQAKGLQCGDVVNLAGDRQAVMLLKKSDETVVYHGDPNTYKVSLLGFRPTQIPNSPREIEIER